MGDEKSGTIAVFSLTAMGIATVLAMFNEWHMSLVSIGVACWLLLWVLVAREVLK